VGETNLINPIDAWNGEKTKAFRKSILDGSFRFCSGCPSLAPKVPPLARIDEINDPFYADIIQNKRLTVSKIGYLNLAYDRSCNLKCPSCRTQFIHLSEGPEYERLKTLQNKIIKDFLLKNNNIDKVEYLKVTGSGDPFGSKLYMDLLKSINDKDYPPFNITILTNGVLLTEKTWSELSCMNHRIKEIEISVDAVQEETYSLIRGGSWKILSKNLRFISRLRNEGRIDFFKIIMVVQKHNWKEMKDFIQMGKDLNVDEISFSPIRPWSGNKTHCEKSAVHVPSHPEYHSLLDYLKDPIFNGDSSVKIQLGALQSLRPISQKK